MIGLAANLCHCRGEYFLRPLCLSEREVSVMYQIYALLGLMCFTWGAAIYASYAGESLPKSFSPTV
jgi:hypothetical protein